ncbi:MAG TPA: ABC transporter ATP-binding protein [Candidatus Blautia stercoravium]|nr:ABC transporter ATP-binding protein [Candidatus Blautia stercoravium]
MPQPWQAIAQRFCSILICDEATSALDVSVQKTVIELLVRLQIERHISMVFICHDIALMQSFAHQIAVMYLGHVVELIPGEQVGSHGAHPYTQALLQSLFSVRDDRRKEIEGLEGEVPSPCEVPKGCPFWSRCRYGTETCREEKPKLKEIAPGHLAACHRL